MALNYYVLDYIICPVLVVHFGIATSIYAQGSGYLN